MNVNGHTTSGASGTLAVVIEYTITGRIVNRIATCTIDDASDAAPQRNFIRLNASTVADMRTTQRRTNAQRPPVIQSRAAHSGGTSVRSLRARSRPTPPIVRIVAEYSP